MITIALVYNQFSIGHVMSNALVVVKKFLLIGIDPIPLVLPYFHVS
jgi:hypothetical protein